MAFCTNCGANVTGAFCNQCGTPARAQAASGPPPVAQPASFGQPAPGVAPAARKTSPIVWILVIVLGLFVLGFIGVVGTGFFIARKAMRAGLDPDLMKRNPGLALTNLMTT